MTEAASADDVGPRGLEARSDGSLARAVVETVRAPLLVLDESMRVVQANPSFFATFGLESDTTVGRGFFELADAQWATQELPAKLGHALEDREEIRDLEVRLPLHGLGVRTLLVSARRVQLEDAERKLLLLVMEDVTVERRLQESVRDYATRLERSNRDLQDFAHAASHDLQEPLRKVRTYAERLRARLDPSTLDERSTGYLHRMSEAVERMQVRIDDLLRLARVGRAEPRLEWIELDDVVGAVLEDLEMAIEERGAAVEVGPLPALRGDASQLHILFQNLLQNALKFHREGVPPVVRIGVLETAAGTRRTHHRIFVEDEGIGFEAEYAERIFRPFERLHGRDAFEGSGVGLALCRRVAEHHHGSIMAEATPGRGSRFVLSLPLDPSPETPA